MKMMKLAPCVPSGAYAVPTQFLPMVAHDFMTGDLVPGTTTPGLVGNEAGVQQNGRGLSVNGVKVRWKANKIFLSSVSTIQNFCIIIK